jgi:hypothetical protein
MGEAMMDCYYLDGVDGFMSIYKSQNYQMHSINMFS